MTNAFIRFELLLDRTNKLIEAGNIGIGNELEKHKWIKEKFEDIPAPRGRKSKNYKPDISSEKLENGDLNLKMDDRSAFLLKNVMMGVYNGVQDLSLHLNSVMLVYIWGSFETYLYMLVKEMFQKRPEMLKSGATISYKEVIENKDKLLDLIIGKELEMLGHYNLDEYLKYLDKKISYSVHKTTQDRLKRLYLLRNIIAHNTGIVSDKYKNRLPKTLRIKENEIHIPTRFLKREVVFIGEVVKRLEKHVNGKVLKTSANSG
jgi:hypothetical protein